MNKVNGEQYLSGQRVTNAYTLKTTYDNNSIEIIAQGEVYRMKAGEILSMINEFVFKKTKAKKYTYLTVDWDKTRELHIEG